MELKPYLIVAVVLLLVALLIYSIRHKNEILAEAWPDQYGKKQKKKNLPPRLGAKAGAKKRPITQ